VEAISALRYPHEHVLAGIHGLALVAEKPRAAAEHHRPVSLDQRPDIQPFVHLPS
jgi:hypothetical protein